MNLNDRAYECLVNTLDEDIARLEGMREDDRILFHAVCEICAKHVSENIISSGLKEFAANLNTGKARVEDFILAIDRDGLWETFQSE